VPHAVVSHLGHDPRVAFVRRAGDNAADHQVRHV
jgi:hypothetical protein